jgi:aminoglycoside 2'-N-acetyltransferase I
VGERRLDVVPTADLDVAAAWALCVAAFDPGDFTAADWGHGLGGLHAVAYEGARLVGHAALVTRRLLHGGRVLRTGYVEAVAVAPDARRRGHGRAVVGALHRHLDAAYELGALATSDEGRPLYTGLGWRVWAGTTAVLTPEGVRPTPDEDGAVLVRPGPAALDPALPLVCDWRDGDVW